MADKILIRRGNKAALPTLADGELAIVKDEKTLYAGIDGKNYPVGGKSPATYICTTQAEFDAAITAINASANGGKIILREGTYDGSKGVTKPTVIEGMGDATDITLSAKDISSSIQLTNIHIKNAKVKAGRCVGGRITLENCTICGTKVEPLFMSSDEVRIIGGSLTLEGTSKETKPECQSGFVYVRGVHISNCKIKLTNPEPSGDYDVNLIYQLTGDTNKDCSISNCDIHCGTGTNIMCWNHGAITGSVIFLEKGGSISQYNAGIDPLGTFTGNYVEYYDTYMKFGTVSGNQFNHKAAGSTSLNQMILQCPTNMTGNTFTGNTVYINGGNKKHIITNNLHDNGLTVGNAESGSVTTGNLEY